jgi:hypothetical protein
MREYFEFFRRPQKTKTESEREKETESTERATRARACFLKNNVHQKASGLKSSFDSLLVTEVGTTSLGVGFCV